MQAQPTTTNDNYSLEIMVRYAFDYEVQNKLQLNQNQNDPEIQAIIRYMKRRIEEIAKKYK
jgi:hypothetical protein